jgi:hypothetical protein
MSTTDIKDYYISLHVIKTNINDLSTILTTNISDFRNGTTKSKIDKFVNDINNIIEDNGYSNLNNVIYKYKHKYKDDEYFVLFINYIISYVNVNTEGEIDKYGKNLIVYYFQLKNLLSNIKNIHVADILFKNALNATFPIYLFRDQFVYDCFEYIEDVDNEIQELIDDYDKKIKNIDMLENTAELYSLGKRFNFNNPEPEIAKKLADSFFISRLSRYEKNKIYENKSEISDLNENRLLSFKAMKMINNQTSEISDVFMNIIYDIINLFDDKDSVLQIIVKNFSNLFNYHFPAIVKDNSKFFMTNLSDILVSNKNDVVKKNNIISRLTELINRISKYECFSSVKYYVTDSDNSFLSNKSGNYITIIEYYELAKLHYSNIKYNSIGILIGKNDYKKNNDYYIVLYFCYFMSILSLINYDKVPFLLTLTFCILSFSMYMYDKAKKYNFVDYKEAYSALIVPDLIDCDKHIDFDNFIVSTKYGDSKSFNTDNAMEAFKAELKNTIAKNR